ncbi:MAG: hypothetical protein IJZ88_04695 [Clostridia bacterium]|nr:hypothetical protein [Clostridia bacterium]
MSKKNKEKVSPAIDLSVAGSNNKRDKIKSLKENLNKKKAILAVVLVLAVVAVTVVVFSFGSIVGLPSAVKDADFKGRLEPDSVAIDSSISQSQQKTLAKSVNAKGNVGAFDFYVNEELIIEEHTDPVLLELGNVGTNDCVLVAFLLDENNEIIYRSLGLEPGKEIRSVKLFDSVPYGIQKATLVVNGYDSESYEKIGTQTVKINLKIGVDTVEE